MINGTDTLAVEPVSYESYRRAAVEALQEVRVRRRRRRWRAGVLAVVVLVLASVAGLIFRHGSPPAPPRANVAVKTTAAGSTIRLTAGRIDIGQLRSALVRRGDGGLLAPVGGGLQLDATLVVGTGARLDVDGTALFLRSDGTRVAHVFVDGGTARFQRDTVLSWTRGRTPDTDLTDGRAYIVATGRNAHLSFVGTTVGALGADGAHAGVTWENGASGQVLGSTFTSEYRGAYARQAGRLIVRHSTFTRAAENGLILDGVGAGSVVSRSTFRSNKSSGIEVDNSSGVRLSGLIASGNAFSGITLNTDRDVVIRGGVYSHNRLFGVALGSSVHTRVTGARAFSNGSGAQVNGGDASVVASFFSGNLQNGVFVSTDATTLVLRRNRLDHNEQAGLRIAAGGVTAVSNDIDTNQSGVVVDSRSPRLVLRNNTITGSSVDGVGLTAVSGSEVITGNKITDNAKSAISVPVKTDVNALLSANTLGGDQPDTRVRGK
jgi:parallel beta-helix repeat protein